MKEVAFNALQQTENNFRTYKKQFFNKKRKSKIGRPKFKNKYGNQSFRLAYNKINTSYFNIDKIHLSKIGRVRINLHRELPSDAKILNCTVSKTKTNKYYVSILVETEMQSLPKTNSTVGIDLGLKTFATLSNSEYVENPRFLRENQSKLSRYQRILSKKKIGSNRYNKHKRKLARLHEKVVNQRNNFLHNLTIDLVKNYDLISVEDLSTESMLKNKRLAYSISDVSWSKFLSMLEYKCNYYDKTFVKIDRYFPSSKTCNNCGLIKEDLRLSDRIYECESCDISIDRDLNAALNIEAVGVSTAKQSSADTIEDCIRTEETVSIESVEENV